MLNKLAMQIKSYERRYGITDVNLDTMDDDQMTVYLTELRHKYQKRSESTPEAPGQDKTTDESTEAEGTEFEITEDTTDQENIMVKSIAAAAAIQDTEAQEKELDELLLKLKKVNRHWKVQWARGKKVPLKALLHAANLWLSDDTDDWSAANNTIFQFTSQWGRQQLCHRRAEK